MAIIVLGDSYITINFDNFVRVFGVSEIIFIGDEVFRDYIFELRDSAFDQEVRHFIEFYLIFKYL